MHDSNGHAVGQLLYTYLAKLAFLPQKIRVVNVSSHSVVHIVAPSNRSHRNWCSAFVGLVGCVYSHLALSQVI